MGRPKSDLLKWDGSWHEIAKAIINAILDQGGTDEDVRAILKNKQLATDIAKLLIAARSGAVETAKPVKPPLVGTVVKTIRLAPYAVSSLAEAIRLGNYSDYARDILSRFADDELGLAEPVNVDLVEFDRNLFASEVLEWGVANGKKPMQSRHLHAIGIQHPEEQRQAPVVGLGSVRQGSVLCLVGSSGWRNLNHRMVIVYWDRLYLFGFLSE